MIIGLGHRCGVGKNTIGEYLAKYLQSAGYNVGVRSYADELKRHCHELYSWAGLKPASYYEENYQLKEVVLPLIGKSPRQIWIEFGTTVCRAIYKDTWIKAAFSSGKDFDILILTDARFPNELDAIKD